MKKLMGLVATVVFVSGALGQPAEPKAAQPRESEAAARLAAEPKAPSTAELLNARVPEVLFDDVPLEQVMQWLGDYTGVNVWVRWQVLEANGIERDKPISIKVRNLRLSQVLWMILNEAGGTDVKLGYGTTENLLLISTRSDLSEELVVRVYDLRDILARVPRFRNAGRINAEQALQQGSSVGGSGGAIVRIPQRSENGGPQSTSDEEMEKFIRVIVNTIEPNSWRENGGQGTIMAWRGKIVVRNSMYVHQLLSGALKEIDTP